MMTNNNYTVPGFSTTKQLCMHLPAVAGRTLLLLVILCNFFSVFAQQDTDHKYQRLLKDVLTDIQKQYGVTIRYDEKVVEGKILTYANWRLRPDVEETLKNVLAPFDLKIKPDGDKKYKISEYEYYRWDVEDGWKELDRIASQYTNLQEWETRKKMLKPCILKALQLSKLPTYPLSKPIITPKRKYNGYTVENVAIEILKGVWINGSLYKPSKYKGKIPVILNPDGHWSQQRYRQDCQLRCASLARMGAIAFSYDLFAWGESTLQFDGTNHRKSLAQTIQALGTIRILDYLLSLKEADAEKVGITGGSGGGSHTALMAAIDDRIKVSAPVVAISSYFYGGCPCESGMPIHLCGGGTDNVEIAAMAAPHPQLLVSDGGDWTNKMPEHDLQYLKKVYGYYDKSAEVHNAHFPTEGHDFGINKRKAVYDFMADYLQLNINAIKNSQGEIDESFVTVEPEQEMYVFGDKGEKLPAHAIHGFENLEKLFYESIQ
ncbi:MAG: alpha/beta hydrolase family protein [Niabella sp.]